MATIHKKKAPFKNFFFFFGHGTSVGAGSAKALGSKEKGRKESLILPIYWKSWGVLCLFVQSTELCGFKVQSSKPIG